MYWIIEYLEFVIGTLLSWTRQIPYTRKSIFDNKEEKEESDIVEKGEEDSMLSESKKKQ